MTEQLKPCPFCDGAAHFFKITDLDDKNFGGEGICCGSCPITTDLMFPLMEDCKPKLAEAWNRRAQPAQQPQYEAGDMASAHNDGFRAGVASVAQHPHEIEVQCPVCNHKFYEWPNDQQPQAEAVPNDVTRDAARYLWLRSKVGVSPEHERAYIWLPCGNSKINPAETDAAIDAAMAQGEKP